MSVRTCLAAGVTALAMLFAPANVSAKPGGRAGPPGRRPAGRPGGTTIVAPKVPVAPKTVVAPKAPGAPKTIVGSRPLAAPKQLALKPAYLTVGGKSIATGLYASKFGFKTKGGLVAYKGLKHGHWTRKWFDARSRCWLWYCPSACGWYYWCGARGCYLPVRCLPDHPPTVVSDGAEPELPPGAGGVP